MEWGNAGNFGPWGDQNAQTPKDHKHSEEISGHRAKKTKRTTAEITSTRANMRTTKQLEHQGTTRGNPNTHKRKEKRHEADMGYRERLRTTGRNTQQHH